MFALSGTLEKISKPAFHRLHIGIIILPGQADRRKNQLGKGQLRAVQLERKIILRTGFVLRNKKAPTG